MRTTILCLLALAGATPALAQSPYVAAGVGADVLRARRIDAQAVSDDSASGEAVSFSARVGTAVTDRWGVELEFTQAMDIDREVRRGLPVPLLTRPGLTGVLQSVPGAAFPTFESNLRLSRRGATLDAVAWVAQPAGSRVDLIYLGGIAFTRTVQAVQFSLGPRMLPAIVVPASTRTTTYGAGPVVGLEARVRLTDHVRLLPGVRLHGIGGDAGTGAWLLRPAVGLGWQF